MAEQPRQRRSFRVIIKFFKILAALIFVFWASFFVTLAIRSTHPIDYLFSYVEDFFGEPKNDTPVTTTTEKKSVTDKTPVTEKNTSTKPAADKMSVTDTKTSALPSNEDVGVFDRVGRIFSIEDAVNARAKMIPNYVKLDDIPRQLRQAIIAVEDKRFYTHSGFDVEGIARAAVVNVEA